MWSLPELEPKDADKIEGFFKEKSIWSILLFQRADGNILRALENNWDLFSRSLGTQAHVITLLKKENDSPEVKLTFPDNYETLVGDFCAALSIPIDELPALVLLNGNEDQEKGPPYWSFAGDPDKGSKMLIALIGDIQFASFNVSSELPAGKWHSEASRVLTRRAMGRFAKRFVAQNADKVLSAVKYTISRLKFPLIT